MGQIERRGAATVPNLDGRPSSGLGLATARSPIGRFLAAGPVALVLAGVAATMIWAGFLAWCLFGLVRWAVG
jgi:hypothetical protein